MIINTELPSLLDNTHYFFHVKFNLILQLIKGINLILQLIKFISSDLKKLLKYFHGTTTFTFNVATLLSTTGLPNKLTLYLKELELLTAKLLSISPGGSSRLY